MAGKRTKVSVNYRLATTSHTCHNCKFMNDDGSCQKVQGQVQPHDVCDLWKSGESVV